MAAQKSNDFCLTLIVTTQTLHSEKGNYYQFGGLKSKAPSIMQFNIFKTLCLSIKTTSCYFTFLYTQLHCTLTTRIVVPAHSAAHTCSFHTVIEHV